MKYISSFRLDEHNHRRLTTLGKVLQRSRSNLLRWLITQEYIRQDLNTLEKDGIPSAAELEEFRLKFKEMNQEVEG